MRKTVVLGLVMFIMSTGVLFAQVSFGVKAGVGMSSYTGSDWNNYIDVFGSENRLGVSYNGGLFLNSKFQERFAIQTEVLFYSLTGGENMTLAGEKLYYQYREMGVEVPFYFQYLLSAGPGSILFSAGPEILISLGNIKETGSNGLDRDHKASELFDNVLRGAMCYGIGYEIGHWQSLVLYKRGFTTQLDDFRRLNQSLSFEVGYLFN